MGRRRNFDPEEVLVAAREIFWTNGYQRTSLDEITLATGLARPSLYAAFGSKASFFLRVLDDYHDAVLSRTARILSRERTAREAVQAWLSSLVGQCSGPDGRRGCLSVNASAEIGPSEATLKESVNRFNAKLEGLISARLTADRGQFSEDFDPLAAARTMVTFYIGLMSTAKHAPSRQRIASIVEQVAKLLDGSMPNP